MTPSNKLTEPATVDLSGSASTAEMAKREGGYDPDKYALCLAHHIRNDGVSLDVQRERLAALATLSGHLGVSAAADELARHFTVLNALFDRLALQAARVSGERGQSNAQAAERLVAGAIKAQKAAAATLGAINVLRQQTANTSPEKDRDNSPPIAHGGALHPEALTTTSASKQIHP